MRSIRHVNSSYAKWFVDEQYFKSRLDDVFFIGFQETLRHDFDTLATKLSLPGSVELPADDYRAHRNPNSQSASSDLDEHARLSLRKWFEWDYRFMDLCKDIVKREGWL